MGEREGGEKKVRSRGEEKDNTESRGRDEVREGKESKNKVSEVDSEKAGNSEVSKTYKVVNTIDQIM